MNKSAQHEISKQCRWRCQVHAHKLIWLGADAVNRYPHSFRAGRQTEYHLFGRDRTMDAIIRQFDRATVTYTRKHLETALEPLAEKLGVAIELGPCRFQANNCRFELKIAVRDCNGEAITEEAESFKCNAKLFGFEPADLGKEFVFRGQSYTICGLRTKSHKYPVIARSGTGSDYKFACRIVLKALGREAPPWL